MDSIAIWRIQVGNKLISPLDNSRSNKYEWINLLKECVT